MLALALPSFWLTIALNAFPAWVPLLLSSPLEAFISSRPARMTIAPPISHVPHQCYKTSDWMREKTFRSFFSPFYAAQGVVARARPSRPSFPSVLYMAASRWKRRRRGRIGSTYVGKDVSISPLFAKWRLTSNENIAFSKIREAFYRIWTSAALHRHWCEQH